jgi:hypothetical protein
MMREPEFLRLPGGVRTPEDDRRELRRVAKAGAGASERFLRDLMGDDVYEDWDND